MIDMADKNNTAPASSHQEVQKVNKNLTCWAKFRSLFEDRGFDLDYEYNHNRINILGETQSEEGYRKLEERRQSVDKGASSTDKTVRIDGELSGVINFYEQFAVLGDEKEEVPQINDIEDEEVWKRSSKTKFRVSVRPSMYLTNIAEETNSLDEGDIDELELVSSLYLPVRLSTAYRPYL